MALSRRTHLVLLLAAAFALSWRSLRAAPPAQTSSDPLVLAFYYTWFDENSWTYDRLSDLPAQTYASRDRGAMGRHIDQARAAGIDAFLVAWYGPGGGNQTEPNLAALLEEAAARNFKIGILFETDSPFLGGPGAITTALQHALTVHASQPAYLRVDGRPVIFFWRPSIYSVDAWRTIRNQVDPGSGSIWISEGVNTAYLAVFDGHHLYSNTWNPPADLDATNQKFARLVADARQQYGVYKVWVATVMPGYNDLRIRGGFSKDREGGAYYERGWQAAIGSYPNWIVINSFNEWPEGSYIEPSQSYGDQFIGLTAAWSGRFKAGGGANLQTANPPVAPPPLPTAGAQEAQEPDAPTAYVQVLLANLRGGPSTNDEIVGSATLGAALPISGRSATTPDWWQVLTGGSTAWIYAPLVRAAGPLEQVALVEPPRPAPSRLVLLPTPTPASPPATNSPVSPQQP